MKPRRLCVEPALLSSSGCPDHSRCWQQSETLVIDNVWRDVKRQGEEEIAANIPFGGLSSWTHVQGFWAGKHLRRAVEHFASSPGSHIMWRIVQRRMDA
jgi:hypothetical protein